MPGQVGEAGASPRVSGRELSRVESKAKPMAPEGAGARGLSRDEPGTELKGARQLSRDEIDTIAGEINAAIEIINTRIAFEIEEKSGRVVIKVVDNVTGEVLRQIPPPQLLGVMQKLMDLVGLLVDERK